MSSSSISSKSSRAFDLVIYGATGFTGRLTARYLAANAPPSLKWAIAGRDEIKLKSIAAELQSSFNTKIPYLVGHGEEMSRIAQATRVVITTAGPFMLHGEPLLKACVEAGTDYLDITGETLWVHKMIRKYEQQAKTTGSLLVSMSGFDSVPADLGTFFVVNHVRKTMGVRVAEVTGYMAGSGNVSGGTIASALNLLKDPERKLAGNPFFLTPTSPLSSSTTGTSSSAGAVTPKQLVAPISDVTTPFFSRLFNQYAMLFVMATVNTRIVRRSAAIFALDGEKLVNTTTTTIRANSLSPIVSSLSSSATTTTSTTPITASPLSYSVAPFRYAEYMLNRKWFGSWAFTLGLGFFSMLASIPGFLSLIRRFVPKPGQGPSVTAMNKAWFHYYMVARTEEEVPRTVIARVRGGDGGYEETAKMLAESGIAMALQRAELPGAVLTGGQGGFLTPATCFGSILINRLQEKNYLFEIIPEGGVLAALKEKRPPPPSPTNKEGVKPFIGDNNDDNDESRGHGKGSSSSETENLSSTNAGGLRARL